MAKSFPTWRCAAESTSRTPCKGEKKVRVSNFYRHIHQLRFLYVRFADDIEKFCRSATEHPVYGGYIDQMFARD